MARKIGAVIALDGEQQFRNAVTACTKSLNNMKSALKLVETQTAGQKNSLEALQKKHDALNNVLGASKSKQEAIRQEFEKSKQKYEDIGKKLDEYKENLAEAREKLEKMKASGAATDEELEKQEQAVAKAADAVDRAERSYESAGNKAEDWQRRLNDATAETAKAEQAVGENAEAMEELEKATDGAGGELDEFADRADDAEKSTGELEIGLKSMIKNAAVGLLAEGFKELASKAGEAAKYVVQVGSDFEAGMSKVGAVSGASSKEMEQLSAKAKQMGATTKFSATEASQAMNYMAMAGWKTRDMLSGIEGIMDLAAASGEDLATTSDIVTDALTAFGKTAEDSGRLADIMAAASSNANTNVSMMGETFKYAAPVAGALGASMEDTAIAVGLMANSGIKASQAGTALRTGLTNLVKPSKQASDAMAKYGIEIQKNDDGSVNLRETMIHLRKVMGGLSETEQAAAASAIFGKEAMSGWLSIVNGSDEDFNKLADAIDNSDGAAKSMAETMQDNLTGKITIFQSALEGLGIAVYEKVSEPLQDVVEVATDAVTGLTNAFKNNKAKDYLDDFYESIKAANEETAKSIENAKKTVDDAKSKVGLLTGFEQQFIDIMTECDNFRGSLDELGGKSEQVGYLQKAFDDTTDSIRDTYVITDEFTKSKIDAMVEELSGSVDGLSDAWDSQTGTLSASKKELQEWFSVAKEVAMYEALQDSIKEVTKAYGTAAYEQTRAESAQKAAKKALEDYYKTVGMTEKQIQSYAGQLTVEQQRLDPIYQGYLELKGAVSDTNTEYENATKNMEAAEGEYTAMQGVMSETAEKLTALGVLTEEEAEANEEAAGSIDKKEKSYRGANATFATALDAEKAIREATVGTVKVVNESSEATEKNTKATGRNAEANDEARRSVVERRIAEKDAAVTYEESADATEKAVEAAHKAADSQKTLRDAYLDAKESMKSSFDEIKQSAEAAFSVDPFSKWQQDAEKGMLAFEEAMKSQIDGMLMYKDNLTTVKDNLGETAPEFVQYLEDMGQGGAQFVAEIADAFRTGNADTVYRLMDEYKQAMDIREDVATILEQDKLALIVGLEALGPEAIRAWEDLGYAFDECNSVIEAKGGEMAQTTRDSFWQAVDIAKQTGMEVPAGLAESIRNSEDPEQALIEATAQLNESIRGRGEEMLSAAKELGINVPSGIAEIIKDPEASQEQVQAAVMTLRDSIAAKKPDFEQAGTEAGEGMATSTASGITGKEKDVTGAADTVVNSAKASATTASGLFRMVGKSGMEMLKSGILDKREDVKEGAVNVVSGANETIKLYGERVFEATGKAIGEKLAGGIGSTQSTISEKLVSIVSDAKTKSNEMVSAISQACAEMSRTVSSTYLRFPNIEIPHVRWTWDRITYGNGDWTEVPNFYVSWYAKAMEQGMILDNPTIFGMMNGKLLGAGEAGSETVVGTSSLMSMIETAVQDAVAPEAAYDDVSRKLDSLINILGVYMPQVVDGMSEDKVFDADGSYMGKFRKKLSSEIAMDVRRARA